MHANALADRFDLVTDEDVLEAHVTPHRWHTTLCGLYIAEPTEVAIGKPCERCLTKLGDVASRSEGPTSPDS